MPKILFYALFEGVMSGKTPKYILTAQVGYFPEMEKFKGRDGNISLNLLESRASGHTKDNAPEMRLQAKGSFPFTGLKEYFIQGQLSGYSYGNPPDTKTYGKAKPKENPLYEHRQDAFLFLWDKSELTPQGTPPRFELMVLQDAKVLAAAYCKQLVMGGFDEQLKQLRLQAEAAKV